MTFSNLDLNENILKAITEHGYTNPTPIQEQAIPVILEKKDILAAAQTGTGKTAGFTLPLLELLSRKAKKEKSYVQALILVPTRELALQVSQNIEAYNKYLSLKTTVVFGGVGINPQKAALRKGVDIVIATPGRLLDHMNQKFIDLSKVDFLVLDEADRMLDMGFIHDIKKVIAKIPTSRQTLLFSATFSKEIKKLSQSFLKDPVLVETSQENASSEQVDQLVYYVSKEKKKAFLSFLINEGKWEQVLVFTRTKHGANKLAEFLNSAYISSAAIHGNKSQGARTKALASFKAKEIKVLVATDIAARGIDITLLPHVVNFELPNVPEDYVHRIGRTGRAGNEGEAISLVCDEESLFLEDIQTLINKKIKVRQVEGFTLSFLKKPQASNNKKTKNTNSSNNSGRKQEKRKPQVPKNTKEENIKGKNKKDTFQDQVNSFIERKKEYERQEKRNKKRRVTRDSKLK